MPDSLPPALRRASLTATLSNLMDDLPDAVLVLDEDWRIVYANKRGLEISRIGPEHFNNKTHWELYPETIGTVVEAAYREVMSTRITRKLAEFYYAPFNVWLDVTISPLEGGIVLFYRDVTEAINAKQKQHTLEDRITSTLAAVNGVGSYEWDIVNDRVYADSRFATIYGVDPTRAAAGAPIAEFLHHIHPDDVEPTRVLIDAALRKGDFAAQYRLIQHNQSICWVDARGTVTFDNSVSPAKPIRFGGIALDITDQKEAAEALRASEARYRALAELNPQSLWSASPEGLVLYANQRFLDYIGHDFVPRTGTEYIECFDERDRQRVIDVWTHSILTGEDYDIEARLIRASDKTSRWWHLRALPIRDESGMIVQWLGVANDIHESHEANARLREQYAEIERQRREAETIYQNSPIGMALYEPTELRLLRINGRQAQIFNIAPDQALGRTFIELAAGIATSLPFMLRAAAGEQILHQDIEGVLDSLPGEYRYWSANYSPIFSEDGAVLAIATATIEMTQQKRAEAALIQSEKLAAVGRMASSIAHEINNPLESVMNLIYIARQAAILPEVQNYLDIADQELRRVSVIANQTLRFHKQATKPQAVSWDDLLASVLSIYEGRLKNSSILVEKRQRELHPVLCYEGEIRQVLNNLVANAIDAMPSGGRLLLRSRESTDWRTGRRGSSLTVADTGSGIDPQIQLRVFEAFFTTKGNQGTGLGLWISCEILQRHYGRILMRSTQQPGHTGTVFTLFIPYDSTPSPDPTLHLN